MKEVIGRIDHRILLNYRIEPDVLQKHLPNGFRPMLVDGYAIGGICQVSLSQMRAKGMAKIFGSQSHNAAHRVAVHSSEGVEGVLVLRRDTNSSLNVYSGGKMFPGEYRKADFEVQAADGRYQVEINQLGGAQLMSIDAEQTDLLDGDSVFKSMDEVSRFFKKGNLGWSLNKEGQSYDAIELVTKQWHMEPLEVLSCYSAYFDDKNLFPEGSSQFDSAVLMKDLEHSWVVRDGFCAVC
ncbi:DUF2071 domain-containing protein [Rubritalea sp.]|uniref:DUF2071 domain-containing protein n=1 Tax=Rubritalea sp. TaxID=2109375 RepID=UPI003EF29F6D